MQNYDLFGLVVLLSLLVAYRQKQINIFLGLVLHHLLKNDYGVVVGSIEDKTDSQ